MEFVQFHPTGMVWPPSVRGILVTEGVRGEGGVLRNKDGKRFMFDDIPDNYKAQTADSEEEGWQYTQGDKNARRPPELLTRDHVARRIMTARCARAAAARTAACSSTSPGSRSASRAAPSTSRRSCRACTTSSSSWPTSTSPTEPMEVGPTTHYIMGGIRVDGDTQMSTVPGLFAAGECAAGLHGANRLGGNSLSDLLVFGKRAGEYAAKFAKERGAVGDRRRRRSTAASRAALAPFERGAAAADAEGPYKIQYELQDMMQDNVGIVRNEAEMKKALDGDRRGCKQRAAKVGVGGNREYNPGWHTALDLHEPADLLRGDRRCAPSSARRAAAATSARTIPDKDPAVRASSTSSCARGRTVGMRAAARADPGRCATSSSRSSRRTSRWRQATFRIWRGERGKGELQGLQDRGRRGHGRARRRPPDPGRAGQRPGGALELQGGQVRLVLGRGQRHAEADVHDAAVGPAARPAGHGASRCRPSR